MTVALVVAVVFIATVALGRPAIALLASLRARQHAYEDAPKSHAVKSGTPTMGGILFWLAFAVAAAVAHDRTAAELAFVGIGCGVVGFVDDLLAIRGGRNRGLGARAKFAATIAIAVVFVWLAASDPAQPYTGVLLALGPVAWTVPAAAWAIVAVAAIVATTHAVNLTDGLDGLAAGTSIPAFVALAAIARAHHEAGVELIDWATIAGLAGFLVYNRHPARLFMGDTGSLALGGVLAASAILTGTTLVLPVVGGVFVAEALSVIVQVVYYKRTRKRIFRMSPLHHHFELGGWPETTVSFRFAAASTFLAALVLAFVR